MENYIEKKWIPYTPGGSRLAHLAGNAEDETWQKLLEEMGKHDYTSKYNSIEKLKSRGYSVELTEV